MIKKEKLKLILTGFILFITLFSTACNENNAFLNKLKGDFILILKSMIRHMMHILRAMKKLRTIFFLQKLLQKHVFIKKNIRNHLKYTPGF
jgi:hypothetical protein